MKDVNKIEMLVASWCQDWPHLSKASRTWLVVNIWWLALIGAIAGSLAVISIMSFTFLASAALIAAGGMYGAVLGGVAIVAVLLFFALAIICLILTGMAIVPLKAGHKKGWTLLFAVALLNSATLVVGFLSTFNFVGLIWGLFTTAVGVYFLFEIRSLFNDTKRAARSKSSSKS